jgi:hypothetical protein
MAVTQPSAYKNSSYGGKIKTMVLPNIGTELASMQQQDNILKNRQRLIQKEERERQEENRKEILNLQNQDALLAGKLYDKVSQVKGGGVDFQTKQSDYWNNQINEVVKIRQGMQKLPGEEGYIDPVIGARMITNISNGIDTYTEGINEAAAEAIELKESLRFKIGEENALSVTNMNLAEAKLLQDWVNGESDVDLMSNEAGQTILTNKAGTAFNIDEYRIAKDSDRDMFLRVPEYKEPLMSLAKNRLGGVEEGTMLNKAFYTYTTDETKSGNATMVAGSLEVNEEAIAGLVDFLSKNDTTIEKMADDPVYAKVYWADVLGQDTKWEGTDDQKLEMRSLLAQKSVDLVRKLNGTSNTQSYTGDTKILKNNAPRSFSTNNNAIVPQGASDTTIAFLNDIQTDIDPMVSDLLSATPGELETKFETYKPNFDKLKDAEVEQVGDQTFVHVGRTKSVSVDPDTAEEVITYSGGRKFDISTGKGYRNFIAYLLSGKYNSKDNMKFGTEIESILDQVETTFSSTQATERAIRDNTTAAMNLLKDFKGAIDASGAPNFTTNRLMRENFPALKEGTNSQSDARKALFGQEVFNSISSGGEVVMYPINPFLNADYGKGVTGVDAKLLIMPKSAPLMRDIIEILKRAKNYPQFADKPLANSSGDPMGITLKDLFTDKATTAAQRFNFMDAYKQIVVPYLNAIADDKQKLPLKSFINQ